MKSKNRRIVIIGSGIAALSTIFELNKNGFFNILCLSSDEFAPNCSLTSTGINALRGTQSGLSPLGDTLIASHEAFYEFFKTYSPLGVSEASEIHCWQGHNAKLLRRYKEFESSSRFSYFNKPLTSAVNFTDNKAFIISPEIFLTWLKSNSSFEFINDFVTHISKGEVTGRQGEYEYDELILCSGFLAKKHLDLILNDNVKKNLFYSKPVSGAYLEFDVDFFLKTNLSLDKSFSFVYENTHLIFRKDVGKVIIGSTSENNTLNFLANKKQLTDNYKKLERLIGGEFPAISGGSFLTGVRHKTQNREPYWGEINTNIYAIWGLYKTGWSMSFLAAKHLVKALS